MAEVTELYHESNLAQLPPSAWLLHGIERPRNSFCKLSKKGGTSKTSSTIAEADSLARMGLNVLVVDFDPQGNASLALDSEVLMEHAGTSKLGGKQLLQPDRTTIIEVIDEDQAGIVDEGFAFVDWQYDPSAPFKRGGPLVPGKIGKVGVIPAYNALEDYSEKWTIGDLERYAKALLQPAPGSSIAPNARWDVVLADLPPGGGKIGKMATKGSHSALIVATAEPFGTKAVADSVDFVDDVRNNWGHESLELAGLVFTAYDPRLSEGQVQINDLRAAKEAGQKSYNIDFWPTSIPRRAAVVKSQSHRLPVSRFMSIPKEREGATLICQVADAIVLRMLEHMKHPSAEELKDRWERAWADEELSPYVTGKWSKDN